jgi:poly-gamma-glutamate capsule biosynthesis protein CapA/YwtB (metallophosphatase superfamily)
MKNKYVLFMWFILFLVTACQGTDGDIKELPTPSETNTPFRPAVMTHTLTVTPSPQPTITNTSTSTAIPAPTQTPSREVVLAAVGDLMFARTIGTQLDEQGAGVPFANVTGVFFQADLVIGNLECAIGLRGTPEAKSYRFEAPPVAAEALAQGGFDLVSLANNHILDYGLEGLEDTYRYLGEQGILTVGAGWNSEQARAPVVLERNGLRIAILAYVDVPVESRSKFDVRQWEAQDQKAGIAWLNIEEMKADIAAARTEADVVIVMFHNGWENRSAPNQFQPVQAYAAIDAGAALVIGSHPHVLQGVERYHGGIIFYSLGNFVFDDFYYPANYSVILLVKLNLEGVVSYDLVPVVLENGIPHLATAEEGNFILKMVPEIP